MFDKDRGRPPEEIVARMGVDPTSLGSSVAELISVVRSKTEQRDTTLLDCHISWGPEGEKMSPEEKARYIIDNVINFDYSKARKMKPWEIDGPYGDQPPRSNQPPIDFKEWAEQITLPYNGA